MIMRATIKPEDLLVYTLRFTAKSYLFGPISDPSKDIIKKVTVGYVAGGKTPTPSREFTYSTQPRATKSYADNVITSLKADITDIATVLQVNDASSIAVGGVLVIDDENFRVASKSGTKITVERGYDSTTATNHVLGADVKLITAADADLIEFGDNFGFDGF